MQREIHRMRLRYVSFPGARAVLVTATLYLAALFVAATMTPWSNSSMPNGAAEVVTTKFAFSCVNEMQCRLYDKNGFCAVQETGCPTNAAKGLPQSASLDLIEPERAGLRAEKKEGVASSDPRAGLLTTRQQSGRGTTISLQWLPVLLAIPFGPDESTPKPASLLSDAVLRDAEKLQTSFTQAEPFPHIAIDNFMKPEAAEKLLLDFPPFH